MAKTKELETKQSKQPKEVAVSAPNIETIQLTIVGTSPYCQNKFSNKAEMQIKEKHEAGSTANKSKGKRSKRDFEDEYLQAMHVSESGWPGIPANAFRNAAIDVCRMVGFKMTFAKMSIFILADGFESDGTPLIKIEGKPEQVISPVRLPTGVVDLRSRPVWKKWSAKIKIRYDADQFTAADVVNLLSRAGLQVGIGEGRNFSKNSNGLGFGEFVVKE